jgi:hypothetical protein
MRVSSLDSYVDYDLNRKTGMGKTMPAMLFQDFLDAIEAESR